MNRTSDRKAVLLSAVAAVFCGTLLTGCQTTIGGQTLPSPDYLSDDVQYFPAGPEFKLSKQVEALSRYEAERDRLNAQGGQ